MFFLNAMMLVYETVEYRHANEKFKNRRKKILKAAKMSLSTASKNMGWSPNRLGQILNQGDISSDNLVKIILNSRFYFAFYFIITCFSMLAYIFYCMCRFFDR